MWIIVTISLKWIGYVGTLSATGGVLFLISQPAFRFAGPMAECDVSGKDTVGSGAVFRARRSTLRLVLVAAAVGAAVEILSLLIRDPVPASSAARLAGLILLMTLPFVARLATGVAVAGATLVALSFALTGHATHDPRWLMSTLVVVHLAAASFWIGALWPLHRLAQDPAGRPAAALSAERFGRQAAWSVAALAVVGIVLAALLLGSVTALFTTSFGWTLLAKLALVTLLLALAATNKWRLVPALSEARDEARAASAARRLRRSIRIEAGVFLAILLATSVLATATRLTHAH